MLYCENSYVSTLNIVSSRAYQTFPRAHIFHRA